MDAKDFRGALSDFDAALAQVPPGAADVDRARLLAGGREGRGPGLGAETCCCCSGCCNHVEPRETPHSPTTPAAGQGLALEGVGDWAAARDTYTSALQTAEAGGQLPDPYVLNSRGNCQASLGARASGVRWTQPHG